MPLSCVMIAVSFANEGFASVLAIVMDVTSTKLKWFCSYPSVNVKSERHSPRLTACLRLGFDGRHDGLRERWPRGDRDGHRDSIELKTRIKSYAVFKTVLPRLQR